MVFANVDAEVFVGVNDWDHDQVGCSGRKDSITLFISTHKPCIEVSTRVADGSVKERHNTTFV